MLHGNVDLSAAKKIPAGHPVDVLINENKELRKVVAEIENISAISYDSGPVKDTEKFRLTGLFNSLWDVDKHYQRRIPPLPVPRGAGDHRSAQGYVGQA